MVHINIADTVLDFIYPVKCMFCGKIVSSSSIGICGVCEKSASGIEPPFCLKCGRHMETGGMCEDCRHREFQFDKSGALWPYEGILSRAVLDLKFNRKLENGRAIGALCAFDINKKSLGDDIDYMIPVPLSKQKMRKRGYNQAEIIAKEIGTYLKIPVRSDLLTRIKKTSPMMDLSLSQRLINIKDSMRITFPEEISGKSFLIIDDIFTTGTTLNECASELKKCGADKVNCYCVCVTNDNTV